jgi:hypothetical protein
LLQSKSRRAIAHGKEQLMSLMRKSLRSLSALAACGLIWGFPPGSNEASAKKKQNHAEESAGPGSLWTDPINLESRDLYYGSGGEKRAPQGGITFQKEDLSGTNPKMDVTDEAGVKWKLKLGSEARPEVAATRFVWAAGYFTADDYLLREIHIANLPGHLRRGSNEIHDGTTGNARVKRNPEGYEKKGIWSWKDDPFDDSREYNGLRVMMALINNWDLKDVNNEEFARKEHHDDREERGPDRMFLVSDLGTSFGPSGMGIDHRGRKGSLEWYRKSKFISKSTPVDVDFATPSHPGFIILFNPPEYFRRMHEEWIGRHIPRADVQWIAGILARLSDQQIRDAFRAGGFSSDEIDGMTAVMEQRIAALKDI